MKHVQNPWKTVSTREVYKNAWIRVREDKVIRPDGKPGIYGVVEFPGAVGIVALNAKNEIVLVGQWRYTLNKYSWEIPTGGIDKKESPLHAAKRELNEETGVFAKRWKSLGTMDTSNGATDEVAHLFLATDLTNGNSEPEEVEDLQLQWIPLQRAVKMVMNDDITESLSIAAIFRANAIL